MHRVACALLQTLTCALVRLASGFWTTSKMGAETKTGISESGQWCLSATIAVSVVTLPQRALAKARPMHQTLTTFHIRILENHVICISSLMICITICKTIR